MKLKIRKLISAILLSLTLVVSSPLYVLAEAPSAPSAPTASTAPEASQAPEASSAPQASPAPTSASPSPETSSISTDPSPSSDPSPSPTDSQSTNSATNSGNGSDSTNNSSTTTDNNTQVDSQNTATVGNNLDLNSTTGDNSASYNTNSNSTITTGDALASAIIETTVNNVTVAFSNAACCAGGASATNSQNGAGSQNSASSTSNNTTNTDITNSANILNGIIGQAVTGNNDTNYNTGGDSEIITGDANLVTTIITDANAVNLGIYEFDINGDQNGDIVLAPNLSNCVNCASGTFAVNEDNGAGSANDATAASTNTATETIENDGDVVNNIDLAAISGKNDANYNTNGNNSITTGDANVIANVVNALNTVVDGVIYTVNILGNLVGNILLPEQQAESTSTATCGCCAQGTTAVNSGNGSDSTNASTSSASSTSTTTQTNNAKVDNNLNLDANTGYNDVNFNTGGDSIVQTGDVTVDANVINVANVNISGGPCDDPIYMVFVNDPNSNWQGQIAGAAPGTYFFTSDGLVYTVDEGGNLIAVNSENGAGSTNTSTSSVASDTNITQNNTASITNNINIKAETGDNEASYNTGGESTIKTGDANIMLNVINFINSNFSGRKVVMTVVNVIGSWIGHFVPPGFSAPQAQASAQGSGSAATANNSPSGDSSGGSGSSSSSSSSNGSGSPTPQSLAGFVAFGSNFTGLISGFRTEKIVQDDNSIALAPQGQSNPESQEASSFNMKFLLFLLPALLLALLIRGKLARQKP